MPQVSSPLPPGRFSLLYPRRLLRYNNKRNFYAHDKEANYGTGNHRRQLGRRGQGQNHRYDGGALRHRRPVPGGANAGHTIINDYGRFALHLLPSGVCYPHITNIIGNGVAFHVPSFLKELQSLKDGGVPTPKILVSERVQLLMPYHVLQDTYEEERLAGRAFGSTRSGIAPFYSDKYAKIGIQLNELFDEAVLRERWRRSSL